MSIQFNDETNLSGLVQRYEDEIGANTGDVSGNTERLKKFTAKVNSAINTYFEIGIQASGKWQLDDTNHTDYPTVSTDLIALQRDYTITTDGAGNLVKDIYKVMLKNKDGVFYELKPRDMQTDRGTQSFWDEQDTVGTPQYYDKTANGIILDVLPDWNWRTIEEGEKGLKLFVNRNSSYCVYTDTTKVIGFPYYQEYFYLKPALEDARINNLPSFTKLRDEVLKLEGEPLSGKIGLISKAYGARSKDEQTVLRPITIISV